MEKWRFETIPLITVVFALLCVLKSEKSKDY